MGESVFSWKNLTDELLQDLLYDLMVMNLVGGRCSKAYSFPSWYYCVTFISSWYKSEFLLYGGLQQRKKEKKTESGNPRTYYLPWRRKGKNNFDGLHQERSSRRRSQKHSYFCYFYQLSKSHSLNFCSLHSISLIRDSEMFPLITGHWI